MNTIAASGSASPPCATTLSRPPASHDRAGVAAYQVEIFESLSAIEPVWRAFERDAVMSPYGRFDWIAAYARLFPDQAIRIALVRDADLRLIAIAPLTIGRSFGARVASAVGGKHVNYNLLLTAPDVAACLDRAGARALLLAIGRAAGVDLVIHPNVPVIWDDHANPFAALGQPSASDAWSLKLGCNSEAALAGSMSAEARKKLRNKTRGIAKLGTVAFVTGHDLATVDLLLDAFFLQKEARFSELGLADPFAEPAMRAFLRTACRPAGLGADPAIELYGLTVSGHVVAVFGGAADRRRISGMFVSFEQGPFARFSPGEMLVAEVIARQSGLGRTMFDLGVGDARYKRSLCDVQDRLVDVIQPITLSGRLHGLAQSRFAALKRRLKANETVMATISRLRRSLGSRRL